MDEQSKQDAPLQFRPYPPVAKKLAQHDPKNLNYYLNCIVGAALGADPKEIEKFRRWKPGEKDESEE